ncbi:MAG: hypothetical protein ACXVRK_00980 [Gaiellaceae bacterium]
MKAAALGGTFVCQQEGAVMGMLFTVLSIALVVAVFGVVAFVLFVEPFVDHTERFRDSRGRRLGSSPRLD